MSGIFGAFRRTLEPVEADRYTPGVDAMAHRGPDGQQAWCDGPVYLAHCMLHTTPESVHEELPFAVPNTPYVITADARIDNRDELIRRLHIEPAYGAVVTDSEVILAAYRAWGEECPMHLVGDYAFVVWDAREKRLFCARDPIGMKPFYYRRSAGRFLFASELRSLLATDEVPQRVNESAIAHHLRGSIHYEREITFWEDIKRLPGGHALVIEPNTAREWEYWPTDDLDPLRLGSDEEYAEAFRELFKEAVRCRLRSAYPVGGFLSGGLDSSSVACMARDLLSPKGKPLHTFSAVWPSLSDSDLKLIDEREYIQAVLDTGGFIPHTIRADEHSPLEAVEQVLDMHGQLLYGTNFYLHWNVYQRAHDEGVRVLLDGLDGDTVVSHGYTFLADLLREERWDEFVKLTKALEASHGIPARRYADHYGTPVLDELMQKGTWSQYRRLASFFREEYSFSRKHVYINHGLKQRVPSGVRRMWNRLRGRLSPPESPQLISENFAQRVSDDIDTSTEEDLTAIEQRWSHIVGGLWQEMMELDDVPAARYHIEPRSPFFDRRLVEFCVTMPRRQSIKGGWPRSILRRAMEGVLPPDVQWRASKSNVSPGFVRGLLKQDQDKLERVLEDEDVLGRYVDQDAVLAAYQSFMESPLQAGKDAINLFFVATLYHWLISLETWPPEGNEA